MRKFFREFREMFKGFLYLIKPFWQYGKPYMLLVILPAITLNPIVSVIDVQFTKYFINSILENSLLKIVLTVVLFQGISQLCFIVDEAVSLRAAFFPENVEKNQPFDLSKGNQDRFSLFRRSKVLRRIYMDAQPVRQ